MTAAPAIGLAPRVPARIQDDPSTPAPKAVTASAREDTMRPRDRHADADPDHAFRPGAEGLEPRIALSADQSASTSRAT